MNDRFVLLISSTAALGGLLFGFDTAIISGTIPYIQSYFRLDPVSLGWAVGSGIIGCAIGSLAAGYFADRYGRKAALILCALLFAASGIGVALSTTLYTFISFRIIGGLGVGTAAMVSPMYIAEIAPGRRRGQLVALYQLAIVIGILLAYFTNYYLNAQGSNSWRWMFGSQTVPSALFLGLLLLVPETPRWLEQIKGNFSQQEKSSLMRLLEKKYTKVLVAGILLAVFQQITGINAILCHL